MILKYINLNLFTGRTLAIIYLQFKDICPVSSSWNLAFQSVRAGHQDYAFSVSAILSCVCIVLSVSDAPLNCIIYNFRDFDNVYHSSSASHTSGGKRSQFPATLRHSNGKILVQWRNQVMYHLCQEAEERKLSWQNTASWLAGYELS